MNSDPVPRGRSDPAPLPTFLVCPRCGHGELAAEENGLHCPACDTRYHHENGFRSLLRDPADRFEDEAGCCAHEDEEASNADTTRSYYLPLLRRLAPRLGVDGRPIRVLSAGCGVGADIDVMCEHGHDAWGVDCGGRVACWPNRRERDRLLIANVKALPFAAGSFDVVKTDCLFPHIGVIGDSAVVAPDYPEQRLASARELARVVRPGGFLVMGNPNRLCPFDLFHKGQMKRSRQLARAHWPSEPFLLSHADYRRLFVGGAGCAAIETLPVARYWSFAGASRHPWRRFLVPPLRAYFRLLSLPGLDGLRRSPFNPWLMVAVRR